MIKVDKFLPPDERKGAETSRNLSSRRWKTPLKPGREVHPSLSSGVKSRNGKYSSGHAERRPCGEREDPSAHHGQPTASKTVHASQGRLNVS